MNIKDIITESQMTCSECGGPAFSDLILAEKKDACYNKVKASAKVWPSAYASGRLVQCRKKGAANWGNKSEGVAEGLNEMDKSVPQPGRDGKVSHSTYGSRDKKGSDYFKGKEAPGKPITKKQMEKHALDILKKQGVTEDASWGQAPMEETYHGNEFNECYGTMWFNEDEILDEAEYHGRKVTLGKPMQGDVKKFKVYVRDQSTGNIKKVNFGDPNMKIRKSNPGARRSFRARHNCDNPGPRTKARYWSCRKW